MSLDTKVTVLILVVAVAALAWVLTRPVPRTSGVADQAALPACTAATRAPATCRTANATLVLGRPRTPIRVGDATAEVRSVVLAGSTARLEVRLRNTATAAHTSPRTQVWLSVARRRVLATQSGAPPQVGAGQTLVRRLDFPLTDHQRRTIRSASAVDVGIAPFDRAATGGTLGVVRVTIAR